jgi:hypothetical protein
MKESKQTKNPPPEDGAVKLDCRAEFIFYAQTRTSKVRPVKILGEYGCDFRRPDWEHRWKTWDARMDPYLHLFLCRDHARKLGLMD